MVIEETCQEVRTLESEWSKKLDTIGRKVKMNKKISIVYFSPTGNTRKTLEVIAEAISDEVSTLDLTRPCQVQPCQFHSDDFVLFGMPVYAGRIPAVARQRLDLVRGDNTPCLAVVSYGNRDYDDALLELSDFVESRGFIVKGAAAVVGRHTYGDIQVNRPDEADFIQDRKFAAAAAAKADNAPKFVIPGSFPYREGGMGGKFRPLTSSACTGCGICVKECPVHAIGPDCRTISQTCLSCFRCIRNCPVHAKNMDTREYQEFADMFTKKLCERKENQYFL